MNRRDLLKWFGAGAVAVPLVGGMPQLEASALIVAPPQIEVPPPPKFHSPHDAYLELGAALQDMKQCEINVYIRRKGQPRSVMFKCDGYLTKLSMSHHVGTIDVTAYGDRTRQFVPMMTSCGFEVSGIPELVEGGRQ